MSCPIFTEKANFEKIEAEKLSNLAKAKDALKICQAKIWDDDSSNSIYENGNKPAQADPCNKHEVELEKAAKYVSDPVYISAKFAYETAQATYNNAKYDVSKLCLCRS